MTLLAASDAQEAVLVQPRRGFSARLEPRRRANGLRVVGHGSFFATTG